jgi:hypothetical protein
MMTIVGRVAASSAEVRTQMYRGMKNIGYIEFTGVTSAGKTWHTECGADTAVDLTRGLSAPHRMRINVHWWDGVVVGFSLRETLQRWVIYDILYGRRKVAAFAVRRSATRWDVLRGRRKVGHTTGRDGPEAATALIIGC